MKPYFETNNGQLFNGDALEVLSSMAPESIQCCITSPPYWGLRDYGTATWLGGDDGCDHLDGEKLRERQRQRKSMIKVGEQIDGSTRTRGHDESIGKEWQYRNVCLKCGAKRIDQQLGLEKTPEEYVSKMVEIFREVRRVLRKDGTLWLNLGSSYASGGMGNGMKECKQQTNKGSCGFDIKKPPPGFKPKDLVPIPWMVAMALQSDGWYLRQDIIWQKPNPMPESVTDRCTKAHEYIFLMSKSAKYYYDNEAIKEDCAGKDERKWAAKYKDVGSIIQADTNAGIKRTKRYAKDGGFSRNKRSVWTVATKPYKEAHFATFPPALILPCILAGTAEHQTILDPFAGSGTVWEVCEKYNRKSVNIELSEEYCQLIKKRIERETRQLKLFKQ